MTIQSKMIQKALADLTVKLFLYKDLAKAGVSDIQIQRTPIATRITARVRKPGMVVGKKGNTIKEVCDELSRRFGIENPQFEVVEVTQPALDAKLMAEKIGQRIEMRPNIKPIMRMALREIMEAGALGAELQVAGKVVGKGGKAKALRVRDGYLRKSGEPMKQVRKGHYVAYLKAGAIGVSVKIVPPNAHFPDTVHVQKPSAETDKLFADQASAQIAADIATDAAANAAPAESNSESSDSKKATPAKKRPVRKAKKADEQSATVKQPVEKTESKAEAQSEKPVEPAAS
ncbi:30S ribosomal protein S3 [Candidatus Micrarchaeota archaeon]|nr:30S ribosomal protein S3 [Candidatus Micrarchaeota archaeon]